MIKFFIDGIKWNFQNFYDNEARFMTNKVFFQADAMNYFCNLGYIVCANYLLPFSLFYDFLMLELLITCFMTV